MVLVNSQKSLLALASILIGFLFVILIRAQGAAGAQAVARQETSVPSLIQTEMENQQLSAENEKIQLELEKYAQGQSALVMADQQLQAAKLNAGLVELSGPGVKITLDDSKRVATGEENPSDFLIHEQYIRMIINALWNGGAEAIAVNGQRVTSQTEVFCSGSYIQINGTRQMPPYVIESIGDSDTLVSALNFYSRAWAVLGDKQVQNGITRDLKVLDKLLIPAGKIHQYKYAEPVKEGI